MYKFAILFTYILCLALCSCFYQSQEAIQNRSNLSSSDVFNKSRQDKNDDKWMKIEVPFGKSTDAIAFGENKNVAIAGAAVLLLSVDNGQTWQAVTQGKGNSMYTIDGGVTYKNNFDKSEASKSLIDIGNLCSVDNAVFTSSGRLYIYNICEHSTSLWSIPTNDPSGKWYIRDFAPSPEQHEKSDNPDYYTPYGNLIVVGKRILIEAVLPNGVSLLTTDDSGATWYPFWQKKMTSRIVGLDFIGEQQGWMLLSDGKILRTLNGGKEWMSFSELSPDFAGRVSSLDFASESSGFIVGEKGIILTTKDGGKTWQRQISNTENFLSKVSSANEHKVWAVGENGTVLESNNGGINWRKIDLGIGEGPLKAIYNLTIKDGKAWIVKDKFIYHSP